jgi:2-iminobutanoate/2-iminopropanoate deaminase
MRPILTPEAPTPAGHYSQAIVHDGLVYVAGQLGFDPKRPGHTPDDIEVQTEQTLRNVASILVAAGSDLKHVLSMTIYVSDLSNWGRVNTVYAAVMGEHKPARAVIPVKDLHYGFGIEIQCIAAVAEPVK